MKYAIKHLFHIRASREEVYKALSTIEGLSNWWTVDTSGNTTPGGIIKFRFDGKGPDMKVMEMKPGKCVTWKCLDVSGWPGHTFTFDLDENDGKTRVRFSHDGWDEQGDFFANCSFTWGRYLESLRQLCQTGYGAAYVGEGKYQSAVSSQ